MLSVGNYSCHSSYSCSRKICVYLCYLWESVIRVIRCSRKICVYLCYLWEIIRVIRVIRVQEKSVYICVICGRVLFELSVVQENLCKSVLSVGECYSSYPLFKKNLCKSVLSVGE